MTMHEMIGERDGNSIVWTCPICGRTVRVTDNQPVTEFVGDAYVSHRGGMGGLQIGSITVGELEDDLTIWREWADEIDLPYCLDNDDAPQP